MLVREDFLPPVDEEDFDALSGMVAERRGGADMILTITTPSSIYLTRNGRTQAIL